MKIEVINTGTELLLGDVLNTHLTYLAKKLFSLGWRIDRQTTVPDGEAIRQALKESLARAQFIVITGGLGPTSDDITRDLVAEMLGRKLIFQPQIFEKIEAYFKQRNLVPSNIVKRQAMVPQGAWILPNDFGTAPGLILQHRKKIIVLLPGPPRELQPMWENHVTSWIAQNIGKTPAVHQRLWRIFGVGESRVQELLEEKLRKLGEFEIGYCARSGEVDFRLLAQDPTLLEKAGALIRLQLGHSVYAEGETTMEQEVISLAKETGQKIASAESCTGGLVANRLTNVPGSSAVFGFGWVTYANESKIQELLVPADLIERHGAVSGPVAEAMALGALKQSGAHLAVAVTGVAGPDGGTPEKPVGLLWAALATRHAVLSLKKNLPPDRQTYKYCASQVALNLLREELLKSR